VVSPALRRQLVAWTRQAYQLAERRACRALGEARSTVRYRSRKPDQGPLRARIRELAAVRVKAGYQTIWMLLRREGWGVNKKRVYRLYREEGLTLARKRRKRHRTAVERVEVPQSDGPNQTWAMDFIHDQLADARPFKVLTVVDAFSRECVGLVARRRFDGAEVAAALSAIGAVRGLPARIRCDNGGEFTSRAFDHWAYWNKIALVFSRPGKPTDNGLIEAFNGTLRRECLTTTLFLTLEQAQFELETWRADYNNIRPHSSLGLLTPAEYQQKNQETNDRKELLVSHA
jgi:putative transposase